MKYGYKVVLFLFRNELPIVTFLCPPNCRVKTENLYPLLGIVKSLFVDVHDGNALGESYKGSNFSKWTRSFTSFNRIIFTFFFHSYTKNSQQLSTKLYCEKKSTEYRKKEVESIHSAGSCTW